MLALAAFVFSKTYLTENVYDIFTENNKITSYNLPFRNKIFTGRIGALNQVKKKLSESNIGIISQSILGIGGIGKTQLATEYAYRSLENKDYDHVVWIAAESANTINNTYNDIADKLGINIHGLKPKQLRKIVHGQIFNTSYKKNILFVLDNVPNKNNIHEYLGGLQKRANKYNKLHILITSRNQNWKNNSLILDIFTPEEAKHFTKKYLPNSKEEDIAKLNKLLQYFPLALGQALGYIQQNTNIKDYITLYTKEQQKYLNTPLKYDNDYTTTLWMIFSVTLEKLSSSAKEILYISSYLEPDKINIDLFTEISMRNKVIKELQTYSLITLNTPNSSFRVHRLLQEVIKLKAGEDPTWIKKATNMAIQQAKSFDIYDKNTWVQPKLWLLHIPTLSKYLKTSKNKIFLLNTYGKISEYFGLYTLAKNLYLDSLKNKESFYKSESNIELADTLNALGDICWRVGSYQEGKKYCHRALDIHTSYSKNPEQSVGLANASHTLGRIQSRLGNYHAAISLYDKSFNIRKSFYKNANHISLAELSANMSFAYCRLGKFQKAKTLAANAVKLTKNYYKDPNHIQLADVLSHLGVTEYYLGNYAAAKQVYQQSLAIKEAHYQDPKHITLSYTLNNLSRTEYIIGNYHRAKELFKKTVDIKKYHYQDPYHIRLASALNGLGLVEETLGNYDTALKLKETAYKIQHKHYKKRLHTILANTCLPPSAPWPTISETNQNLAVEHYISSLEITKKTFGEKHHLIARSHYLLGQAYEVNKQVKQAIHQYKLSQAIAKNVTEHINYTALKTKHQKNIQMVETKINLLETSHHA